MLLLDGSYKKVEPASAAIIMANGIFLIGAVEAFSILDIGLGKFLAFLLLIAWIVIYRGLTIQFFHRDFLITFLKHPVNSFAIGTWIAGVSVLCNVFLKYFPSILGITQAIAIINTFLFLFFLANCIYNFKQLLFDYQDNIVHGMILLSCVGTQSIIVLLNNVFFQLPVLLSETVIMLGILFYLLGVGLIIRRYLKQKGWTLVDDWSNTNCIIHGALSITGFAIVVSHSFSTAFVTNLWMITLILIIAVEAIEIIRAIKRIHLYGWNKGIFTYHVSQWSRNFTFGMFYVFTMTMHNSPYYPISADLSRFQEGFMSVWAWIVLGALVVEIGVFLKDRVFPDSSLREKREVAR